MAIRATDCTGRFGQGKTLFSHGWTQINTDKTKTRGVCLICVHQCSSVLPILPLDIRPVPPYDTTQYVIMSDPTLLVLASLAEGDKHGYAIMVDIEQFAGMRLGPGTLYGAITRLEERGWIRPVGSEDRRQ